MDQVDFGLITPGKLLRDARIAKGISVDEVANAIKVRKDYVIALEANKFDTFDSPVYAKGFLKLYSSYLSVPTEKVIALYRRFTDEDVATEIKPKPDGIPLPKIVITPSTIAVLAVVLVIGFIITYLVIQFATFQKPPKLELVWPASERTEVNSEVVTITGYTVLSANVYVNDESVTVSNDGYFSATVKLNRGDNQIVIKATNDDNIGKSNTLSVYIRYIPVESQDVNETDVTEEIIPDSFQAKLQIDGGDAWIVFSVDGENKYTQTLQSGFDESFTVFQNLSITSGRGQFTKLYINGELTPLTQNNQGIVGLGCRLVSGEVVCN